MLSDILYKALFMMYFTKSRYRLPQWTYKRDITNNKTQFFRNILEWKMQFFVFVFIKLCQICYLEYSSCTSFKNR